MDSVSSEVYTASLSCARTTLDLSMPVVMGVLNVTPDSFSDGGRYVRVDTAIERALEMVAQGAQAIDIGGESTRPGAAPVALADELERVLPVIEGVRARSDVFVSIDTVKPEVMRAACAAGADLINDVTALRAPGALSAAAESGAAVCLMHMQGEPRTMQQAPTYDDVVNDITSFLEARIAAAEAAGIERTRLCIDPGFGFGKTLAHNLELLHGLAHFNACGLPVVVGVSRKSLFARLFDSDDMESRINGSVIAAFWAAIRGAGIIRSHDVWQTCQALTFSRALDNYNSPD